MARIAIHPYGPSDSANLLKNDLASALPNHDVKRLRVTQQSRFRGRRGDKIINWGKSDMQQGLQGQAVVLNNPTACARASAKVEAFQTMIDAGVRCVERTTDRSVAQGWKEEGAVVFARTMTRAHSGEGIRVFANETPSDLGQVDFSTGDVCQAPLYTKGLMGRHREFRIHVFQGKVIFVQLKKRRNGWRDLETYSNVVRNHGNGWIYASAPDTTAPNASAYNNAILAVSALGLDFGAVDVMTNGDEAWVLEVNTAPGLSGTTTRERYVRALTEWVNDDDITETVPNNFDFRNAGTQRRQQPQRESTRTEQAETSQASNRQRNAQAQPSAATQSSNRTTSGSVNRNNLRNEAYYSITYEGERMAARWSAGISSFEICGFDMPIPLADVTNVNHELTV